MAEWETMTKLFDLTRKMAAEMAEGIPSEQFDVASGGANSPKWIVGHLALGMDFGLMLLGTPTEELEAMMPTYGPGSAGGSVGDDGRSQSDLIAHLRTTGDALRTKVLEADSQTFMQKQQTPFLVDELPTVGDLLGHVYTTHIALHMGQLSQIRRELGLPSWYQVA
ncbi:MAG: DinB family protein [Planctomycetota bacterium]